MAKMIGGITGKNNGYERRKTSIRRNEDSTWSDEAFEEIEDPEHVVGMCMNPKTGFYGCDWCYPDDDHGDGWFGDLEGNAGILYNGKPVIDPWEGYFE